jgi:hypothetical protein
LRNFVPGNRKKRHAAQQAGFPIADGAGPGASGEGPRL